MEPESRLGERAMGSESWSSQIYTGRDQHHDRKIIDIVRHPSPTSIIITTTTIIIIIIITATIIISLVIPSSYLLLHCEMLLFFPWVS